MQYRRLGRTGIMASVIGAGTCQLRMLPVSVGIDTLRAGFDLGINIVHVAEDYGGAMDVVHEAVKSSPHQVHVCSNGWGSPSQFEAQFEKSLELFGRPGDGGRLCLDLFGIACPEDREILGEEVWGTGGLVDLLKREKRRGRLRHSFCTTHAAPNYIRRLIESDVFDAVMFSYNPLGHHILSFNPSDNRGRESVAGNRPLIDLAASRDVGVLLMEVLAGGLLTRSRAYALTSRSDAVEQGAALPSAAAVLRLVLAEQPSATCLVIGVGSVEEITENARAGAVEAALSTVDYRRVTAAVDDLKASACSRCGACEPLCSEQLPISWLFRAADISARGAVPFETPPGMRYFELHDASIRSHCETCSAVTCRCPAGIDIPGSLTRAHQAMLALLDRREVSGPSKADSGSGRPLDGRLLEGTWSGSFATLTVRNVGTDGWRRAEGGTGVWLELRRDGALATACGLRTDVPPTGEAYFSFHHVGPIEAGDGRLWLVFRTTNESAVIEQDLGPAALGRAVLPALEEPLLPIVQTAPDEADVWPAFALSYLAHGIPENVVSGGAYDAWVTIQNTGTQGWNVDPEGAAPIDMLLSIGDERHTFTLGGAVAPGETVRISFALDVPDLAGDAVLALDLVRQSVAYFSELGCPPLTVRLRVGTEHAASPPYGVAVIEARAPATVVARARFGVWVRITNTGRMQWDNHAVEGRLVSVVAMVGEATVASVPLPHSVAPLGTVDVHLVVPAPATPGRHVIGINLVHEDVAYFADQGVAGWSAPLIVRAGDSEGARLYEVALESNWAFYHPGGGVSRLADGTGLPQLLERAKGCHVWDTDGKRYLDYTMGWGSALLGHSHNLVEAAVRRAMDRGPTLPLPHRLELELTEALCQQAEIPCAEAVAFGKNGSDVCSLAVRLARLATGRRTILVCGYHGWQDWYAEMLGFAGTGVPERYPSLVVRVDYNDRESLRTAVAAHRHDLAGLIIEPSNAAGGLEMVAGEADPGYLAFAAEEVRGAGGLLIFDEIITGFRYPGGSVQKALGVTPDLACFGKAIANGFAVSALTGRKAVMKLMTRAFYGPTYKGEVYSLAAAAAALSIYRTEPVADQVWHFGRQMQSRITDLCRQTGIPAYLSGTPFRMALTFDEPDRLQRQLMRTLYIQELLRGGMITHTGVMLPSYAHTDRDLSETLSIIERALEVVSVTAAGGELALHRAIEIPLIALPESP